MPKVIENLRENIIRCAKAELLTRGYNALAIRSVAKSCGIAVGTVYNYFPSKDVLAAAVMLEDWLLALERMRLACKTAANVPAALTALYDEIKAFTDVYRAVWSGYSFSGSARYDFSARHNLLVGQLADCLRPVLSRCSADEPDGLPVFLAENLLLSASDSAMTFPMFLGIAARILPPS